MSIIQQSCNNLLQQCEDNLQKPKSNLVPKKYRVPFNNIQPIQLQQNDKLIQKMKKNIKKRPQETFIKKTDLGQDMQTFTKEQFEKLKMIDQMQEQGLVYRQIQQKQQDVQQTQNAVERLKKLANTDDILDEIKRNLQWGNLTNCKQSLFVVPKKQRQSISKGFKAHSKKKINTSFKLIKENIEFVRTTKRDNTSLIQYYKNLLNKETADKKFLDSKNYWPEKTIQLLSFRQKIKNLQEEAALYLQKINKQESIFMTNKRKEALYQNKILKLLKRDFRDGKILEQIALVFRKNDQKENKQRLKSFQDENFEQQNKNYKADDMIDKFKGLIKEQGEKRIQKLIC